MAAGLFVESQTEHLHRKAAGSGWTARPAELRPTSRGSATGDSPRDTAAHDESREFMEALGSQDDFHVMDAAGRWFSRAPGDLMQFLSDGESNGVSGVTLERILRRLGATDYNAAMKHVDADSNLVESLLLGLAWSDREKVLSEMENLDFPKEALSRVEEELAYAHPVWAAKHLTLTYEQSYERLARSWSKEDSLAAVQWIYQLEGNKRIQALGGLGSGWAEHVTEDIVDSVNDWVEGNTDETFSLEIQSSFGRALIHHDVEKGLSLIAELPDSQMRDRLARLTAFRIGSLGAADSVKQILTMVPPLRDGLMSDHPQYEIWSSYARSLARNHPGAAQALAAELKPDEPLHRMLNGALENLR